MKLSIVLRALTVLFLLAGCVTFWLWLVWMRTWTLAGLGLISYAGAVASDYFAAKSEKEGL
jgi:hypothetical protein